MLVVDFDPTNTVTIAAFRARYGISNSVRSMVRSRRTSITAAMSKLYRSIMPQQSPSPDAGYVPYVVADRVSYTDTAPWPTSNVDGGGIHCSAACQRFTATNRSIGQPRPHTRRGGTLTPTAMASPDDGNWRWA